MFENPVNVISHQYNGIQNHSQHGSFFCHICKQRFQSEKNFRRHNNSRKHIKQIQTINGVSCRKIERHYEIKSNNLSLLPNDMINELICGMAQQLQKKDDFFDGIEILDDCEIDLNTLPIQQQNHEKIVSTVSTIKPRNVTDNRLESIYRPNQIDLTRIPATYPCLTCFQLLDSQQNFNEHMLQVHFRYSIDAQSRV